MQLEIVVKDTSGKVVEMTGVWTIGVDRVAVPLFDAAPGYEIEASVKDDKSKLLGTFVSFHAFAPKVVIASKSEGVVAVTDDASNTYTRES